MKIVPLKQGSKEWLEWRAARWMASEAAVIMGCVPSWMDVQTWDDLRLQKAGLFEHGEAAKAMFAHGHSGEDVLLDAWNESREDGTVFLPCCIEHPHHPRLAASLDGLCLGDGAEQIPYWVEIKNPTPRAKWHLSLKTWQDLPEHYQWQMIHQFAAMGVEQAFGWLKAGDIVIGRRFGVTGDSALVERLIAEWTRFEAGELQGRNDNEWTWWAEEYRIRKAKAEQAKTDADEARDKLLELADGQPAEGAGVKVSKLTRKGALDLKAIEADLGFDVDCYRTASTESWTVRVTKWCETCRDCGDNLRTGIERSEGLCYTCVRDRAGR